MTVVKTGEVTIGYVISSWDIDDEVRYDWTADNGDESDELFLSLEEAERDVQDHFGG